MGKDFNSFTKVEIYKEFSEFLCKANILDKSVVPDAGHLVSLLTSGPLSATIKGTRIANLIEFGRIVHAEMMAITDAANRGVPLNGSTLICTTFPCHMCARHIISAGIARVVYIEPYPKSLTPKMYDGLVRLDTREAQSTDRKIDFHPFIGVGPKRYMTFFSMPKRKDGAGNTLVWNPVASFPEVTRRMYDVVKECELAVRIGLNDKPAKFGLVPEPLPLATSDVTLPTTLPSEYP